MEQLIYGSADQITGRPVGGWGVLHATADLTAETQQKLLQLVSVWLPMTMPQFPSAQELLQRSARFRADPSQGDAFVALSNEAGKDHTGRPGNVVTHAARVPQDGVRPADWFFAGGWVTPFGPMQIAQAVPPAELVRPQGWSATAAWLRADNTRVPRLRWLADVVLPCLLRGQSVVLRAMSVSELASWASALTWLIGDGQQPRLRLGEDQTSLAEQMTQPGPAIIGVCFDPDPELVQGLYVDVAWQLDAAAALAKGVWQLPTGQALPATVDHPAVDLAYAADEVALAVLAKHDELLRGQSMEVDAYCAMLQAAWLLTPGAQQMAREEPIRRLLNVLGAQVYAHGELAALAAEVGEAGKSDPDIYSLPPSPEAVWRATEAEDPLRAAILGAARLATDGVNLERLLTTGMLLEYIEDRPAAHQQALRDIAAALQITGEDT